MNTQGGYYGSVLQGAAKRGQKDIMKILMTTSADVNAQGGNNGSALKGGSKFWPKEIVEILMKWGADFSAQGGEYGNALHAAVSAGQEHIIALTLQNNASPEAELKAKYDWSILQAAVASKNSLILTMLLGSGAGNLLNARNTSGQTPFHLAVAIGASELQTLEMLQLLKDSNPNIQDYHDRTPLHLAVNAPKFEAVKYLLDLGAIADTPDLGDMNRPWKLASVLVWITLTDEGGICCEQSFDVRGRPF